MGRDGKAGRVGLIAAAAVTVFAIGIGVGTQIGAGGHQARVPAAVATGAKAAAANSAPRVLDAAASYATVMAQVFALAPDAARAVLAGDASDNYRTILVQSVDTALVPLQQQMAALAGQPIFRQSVLGEKMVSYSPTRAQVSAWVMVVAGQSGVADNAVCSFSTVTLDLVFEHGGWKIDHSAEQPGPSPQMTGAPTSVDVLVGRLDGFNDWRPR
jgi:hypothetical protein